MALALARRCGAQMFVSVSRHHSLKKQLTTASYKQLCAPKVTSSISSFQCALFHRASYCRSPPPPTDQAAAPSEPAPPKRPKSEVAFEELLELIEKETVLLIDVREPKEVEKTGQIPNSINIPLTKLKAALSGDEEEFSSLYERPKPTKTDSNVIFYGLCEVKGSAAVELAHKLGYKQTRHYPGGFSEWLSKHQEAATD